MLFGLQVIKKAKTILEDLKASNLNEINFSTGDDHSKWIPQKNVRNAAVAAARLGFIPIINIETHDNSSPKILQFFGKDKIFMKLVGDKKSHWREEHGCASMKNQL